MSKRGRGRRTPAQRVAARIERQRVGKIESETRRRYAAVKSKLDYERFVNWIRSLGGRP
jgi:hypothetical protein